MEELKTKEKTFLQVGGVGGLFTWQKSKRIISERVQANRFWVGKKHVWRHFSNFEIAGEQISSHTEANETNRALSRLRWNGYKQSKF